MCAGTRACHVNFFSGHFISGMPSTPSPPPPKKNIWSKIGRAENQMPL